MGIVFVLEVVSYHMCLKVGNNKGFFPLLQAIGHEGKRTDRKLPKLGGNWPDFQVGKVYC